MASEADIFADFLTLVVPKAAQEYATWKYDVQKQSRLLTIYRLSDPSASLGYTLVPVITVSGREEHLPPTNRKKILSSARDLQKLLDQLDKDYEHRYRSEEKCAYHDTEPEVDPPDYSDTPDRVVMRAGLNKERRSRITKNLFSENQSHTKRTREESASADCTRQKKKSTLETVEVPLQDGNLIRPAVIGKETNKSRRAYRKKGRPTKEDKVKAELDSSALAAMEEILLDVPALPVHPHSGGTIYSSQYWRTSADDRGKLNCARDIFVDTDVLKRLPDLQTSLPGSRYDVGVKYGWRLLEHLLGGSEAMSRSFVYSSSGSSPIGKEDLLDHITRINDGILEHMKRAFSLDRIDDVRNKIMEIVRLEMSAAGRPKTKVDRKSFSRRLPHPFLREHLRTNSFPEIEKDQLAFGYDLYLNQKVLREVEHRYKDKRVKGQVKDQLKDDRQWYRFGYDLIIELVGGMDAFVKGLKTAGKMSALLGDDIIQAAYDRTRQTFGLSDCFKLKAFSKGVSECQACRERPAEPNTGLRASPLSPSQPTATSVPGSEGLPAEPGCNYWITPAPHRTRLSPRFSVYMDTVRLAEYQRYLGPESTTKNREWGLYTWTLLQYALGGEEVLLKKLLDLYKSNEPLLDAVDPELKEAVFDHVEKLFKLPEIMKQDSQCFASSIRKKLLERTRYFFVRQVEAYNKGTTRWHFPQLDPRLKPGELAKLDEVEYWRKPAPDRTQLRPGHDVYVVTKILGNLTSNFGPQSKKNCIKKYSVALVIHMLGGPETASALWRSGRFAGGQTPVFVFDDLIAVCLHAESVFHSMVSINPAACHFAASKQMAAMRQC